MYRLYQIYIQLPVRPLDCWPGHSLAQRPRRGLWLMPTDTTYSLNLRGQDPKTQTAEESPPLTPGTPTVDLPESCKALSIREFRFGSEGRSRRKSGGRMRRRNRGRSRDRSRSKRGKGVQGSAGGGRARSGHTRCSPPPLLLPRSMSPPDLSLKDYQFSPYTKLQTGVELGNNLYLK